MSDIIPSFRRSIFNNETIDAIQDFSEASIDAVLDDPVINNIPIVKTVAGLCKTGLNLKERNFVRQTLIFLKQFNDGTISEEKLKKHREKLENDPKTAEKELHVVISFLSNNIEDNLSKISAKLYSAYVKGGLSWEKFAELIEVNRRMFVDDYKELILLNGKTGEVERYRCGRLIGLGLVVELDSPSVMKRESDIQKYMAQSGMSKGEVLASGLIKKDYSLTKLGKTLLQFVDFN